MTGLPALFLGDLVTTFVHNDTVVTLHLLERDLMPAGQTSGDELQPEVVVDTLFVCQPLAIMGDALTDVVGISVDNHVGGLGQGFQGGNDSHQLHTVVGRFLSTVATNDFLDTLAGQDSSITADTGIARASTVRENDHVIHCFGSFLLNRNNFHSIYRRLRRRRGEQVWEAGEKIPPRF